MRALSKEQADVIEGALYELMSALSSNAEGIDEEAWPEGVAEAEAANKAGEKALAVLKKAKGGAS